MHERDHDVVLHQQIIHLLDNFSPLLKNSRLTELFNQGIATLTESEVEENSAGRNGGGIFNQGTINLIDSELEDNTPDNIFEASNIEGTAQKDQNI